VVKAIVFDLDDTLYLERDYVASGFRAAVQLWPAEASAPSREELADWLWTDYQSGPTNDAFDRMIAKFEMPDVKASALVSAYRDQQPVISARDGVVKMLQDLRRSGFKIGMITDGEVDRQNRKIDALDIRRLFDEIIITGELGRKYWKPHERAFKEIAERLHADGAVYVGDNPLKDFLAPNRLGWITIRIRTAGQIHSLLEATSVAAQSALSATGIPDLSRLLSGIAESVMAQEPGDLA